MISEILSFNKDRRKNGILCTWNISQKSGVGKWERKWLLDKVKFNTVMTGNLFLGKEKYVRNERFFDAECEEITD